MNYAVTRQAGPSWTDGGIADQPRINDRSAFMDTLADQGFVMFAGPLAGTERGRLLALLIVNADSEEEIRHRLSADPWTVSQRLQITSIEPGTSSSAPTASPRARHRGLDPQRFHKGVRAPLRLPVSHTGAPQLRRPSS
jgi:uncharacterized protein YciI